MIYSKTKKHITLKDIDKFWYKPIYPVAKDGRLEEYGVTVKIVKKIDNKGYTHGDLWRKRIRLKKQVRTASFTTRKTNIGLPIRYRFHKRRGS